MALTTPHASILDQSIVSVDWKVDVVVATGHSLNRVGVPVAVIALTLSSGIVLSYRLSQEELHQWRFQLAKAVRDLTYLQKKQPQAGFFANQKRGLSVV